MISLATVLPDKTNTIIANSDSTSDYDYYQFTSVRGQDVYVFLEGVTSGTSNRWIAELSGNGTTWQNLPIDSYNSIGSLQQNQTIFVRVRPNPTAAWSATAQYWLTFGSKPASGTHSISGESNLVRIPNSAVPQPPNYLTTQVSRTLTWSSSLRDSKGAIVQGAPLYLEVWPDLVSSVSSIVYEAETSTAGSAFRSINMGTCGGNLNTTFTDSSSGQTYNYRAWYNYGAWRIVVRGAPDAGVGGNNTPTVALGHICSMSML